MKALASFCKLAKLHKGSVELCQLIRGKVGGSLKDITAIPKYCTLRNSGTGQILFPGDAAGILSFDTFPRTLEFRKSVSVSHIWERLLTWPNQNTWPWEKKRRKHWMYSALRSHAHKKAPRAMAFLKPVFKYLLKQNIYAIYVPLPGKTCKK